jgi:hypothetical protein
MWSFNRDPSLLRFITQSHLFLGLDIPSLLEREVVIEHKFGFVVWSKVCGVVCCYFIDLPYYSSMLIHGSTTPAGLFPGDKPSQDYHS